MTTTAWGINDLGQIVGQYVVSGDGLHGFLKDGDDYITIDYPNGSNTWLYDINNNGQIIGQAHDLTNYNKIYSFIATPDSSTQQVLEPNSGYLLILGIIGIGAGILKRSSIG
jgi:hypothetical protein